MELKILTLNLHKGFGWWNRRFVLPELREAVRRIHADVVLLQEVLGSHELHALVPQYEFLADQIWGAFAYGRNAVYPKGHHGNAVLSKFPIVEYRNHDVSVGRVERRGLLHCHVGTPAAPLHVICAHLALRERHRALQLRDLCRLVSTEVPPSAALVVGGDFNDWRQRAGAALRHCGLKEAFVEASGRHARSFPARWPLLRLDRIYYRNARVHTPQVHSTHPWPHLSDHLPLSAEVAL